MKFGYDGRKDLIKEYKICDDYIIITYLNNKREIIKYTKEIETKIINKMIKEAIDRQNSYQLKNKQHGLTYGESILGYMAIINLMIIDYIRDNKLDHVSEYIIFGILCSILLIGTYIDEKRYIKKEEELDKYKIYLSLYDKYKDKLLNICNINDIDKKEFEEIKSLERKLIR